MISSDLKSPMDFLMKYKRRKYYIIFVLCFLYFTNGFYHEIPSPEDGSLEPKCYNIEFLLH